MLFWSLNSQLKGDFRCQEETAYIGFDIRKLVDAWTLAEVGRYFVTTEGLSVEQKVHCGVI